MDDRFDFIVIGGGPAGYVSAMRAGRLGLKTALIEQVELGGTCLNRGCIPTKAMLHTAQTLYSLRQCERLGINAENLRFDFGKMLSYRSETVGRLVQGVELMLKNSGVTIIRGKGKLLSGKKVSVISQENETVLFGENVLLASGSEPKVPPIKGIEKAINSDGIFKLEKIPKSLFIIGGGVIGVEFAEIFNEFGTHVIIAESRPEILPGADKDISRNLRMILKKRGIEIYSGVSLKEIRGADGVCECVFEYNGNEISVTSEIVLSAIGRKAKTEGLFEENVGIRIKNGQIAVDENYMTDADGIFAAGDLIGGVQLAHKASAEGKIIAEHIAGKPNNTNLSLIPRCVYTSPEIAEVGLSEREAKEQNISIRIGKALTSANGKSVIVGAQRGFVKVIADEYSGKLLGAALMCERATDMISEFTTAIAHGLTVSQMLNFVRPHPTFEESFSDALEQIL